MDTDQLIKTLAADNAHRARPVSFVLMLALLAAAPVSLVMFFAELGVRPGRHDGDAKPVLRPEIRRQRWRWRSRRSPSACICRGRRPRCAVRWYLSSRPGLLVAGIKPAR